MKSRAWCVDLLAKTGAVQLDAQKSDRRITHDYSFVVVRVCHAHGAARQRRQCNHPGALRPDKAIEIASLKVPGKTGDLTRVIDRNTDARVETRQIPQVHQAGAAAPQIGVRR